MDANKEINPKYVAPAMSFDERVEAQFHYMDTHKVDHANVEAVLTRPESYNSTWYVKEWFMGANAVTDAGDIYYSIKAVGGSPATDENFLVSVCTLANPGSQTSIAKSDTYQQFNAGGTAAITASQKAITSTYPRRDGQTNDAENTGGGTTNSDIVSYKYEWTTGDFNATGIKNGALYEDTTPVNATKLLTHFGVTTFTKDSSSTLKVFVNHTFAGSL
jgi:hypothetical protein